MRRYVQRVFLADRVIHIDKIIARFLITALTCKLILAVNASKFVGEYFVDAVDHRLENN